MRRFLAECWSLPDADAQTQARLLDRQLGAVIPFIPVYVTTNTLSMLWLASAFWSIVPRTPSLIWGACFIGVQAGWLASTRMLATARHRVPDQLYGKPALWVCAFWWFAETFTIGISFILCTPFISDETHRLLLVSFIPGLISAGALASMMLPLLSAIWIGVLVTSSCIAALWLKQIDQFMTRSLLVVYGVALCLVGLALSKMFVGRFMAEVIAERERRSAERLAIDLKRQKEIAEEASRAKSTFLAAASHDLRQPVHALGLFVGALQDTAMPPESTRLVEQINASTDAMEKLFTALLDISRLDAGIVAVERRRFQIDRVLGRVCRDYEHDAAAKGLTLSYVRCRATVDSDPSLIERIVRNLLSNAVRYTDTGRILIGCRRKGQSVVLQVWDTGRGIPAHLQESVFQEYFQAGNPERDREKGLGLGLAIVRRLVELLDCKLVLRSKPGKGSCFEVRIARAESAESERGAAEPVAIDAITSGFVVVIDDEKGIRDGASILLNHWGYDVLAAASANEAIELLAAHESRPDLLISDLRLRDGESGIHAVERIRAEYNQAIPALLITGDTSPNRLAEAQASGLLLLHKPVSKGRLRAAITQLLLVRQDADSEPGELDDT